ncbi:MAG: hypothetical protein KIS96_13555 [Bauldia sp.]|nr:hypothetical protein [Bauldia sp.]
MWLELIFSPTNKRASRRLPGVAHNDEPGNRHRPSAARWGDEMRLLLAAAVAAIAFAMIPYLLSLDAEGDLAAAPAEANPAASQAQPSVAASRAGGGNLAAPPAEVLRINITGTEIDTNALNIETGRYYRIELVSDGMAEVAFSAPEFMQDIHVRLLVIQGIEVHLQGLTFRAIEFDQGGTAAFSFVAIRTGTYPFNIGEVRGTITVI